MPNSSHARSHSRSRSSMLAQLALPFRRLSTSRHGRAASRASPADVPPLPTRTVELHIRVPSTSSTNSDVSDTTKSPPTAVPTTSTSNHVGASGAPPAPSPHAARSLRPSAGSSTSAPGTALAVSPRALAFVIPGKLVRTPPSATSPAFDFRLGAHFLDEARGVDKGEGEEAGWLEFPRCPARAPLRP